MSIALSESRIVELPHVEATDVQEHVLVAQLPISVVKGQSPPPVVTRRLFGSVGAEESAQPSGLLRVIEIGSDFRRNACGVVSEIELIDLKEVDLLRAEFNDGLHNARPILARLLEAAAEFF